MSNLLVDAHGLGKAYPKAFLASDRMRALGRLLRGRRDPDAHYVIRDISLRIHRGESIAIIGENGAGKSTLLKLITGVLTPTSGRVEVLGNIGALLELGAGFHPEYSGRDNVAMSAALHGIDRAGLESRMQQIIDFADIGDYIDEPVKHYSSGMVVRLGFAVIASLKPDLLITDEVLAVGDESFQKKCIRWMENYLKEGGTLLLVTHSMYHAQKLCKHALWLKDGALIQYGDVFDVSQAYLAWHERKQAATETIDSPRVGIEFEIEDLEINEKPGKLAETMSQGETLRLGAHVRSREDRLPIVMFGIVRADGTPVYGVSTDMDEVKMQRIAEGEYRIDIEFPALSLLPGSYQVRAHSMDTEGLRLFDTLERTLTVRGESREFGMVRLPHRWNPSTGAQGG